MELIERTINGVDVAVDPHQSNAIFFDEQFLKSHSGIEPEITPVQICELLVGGTYHPLILTWELLDKCSFACPFCYIVGHTHRKIVRFKEMKPHIEHLVDLGLLHVVLSGGEATLHPDFLEIYCFLKERGVIVEVYSNGSLIHDEHINLFRRYPPYKLEITIYGLTQERFQEATGSTKFSHEEILKTILQLKRDGINVICKTPLNKLTEAEFDEIAAWCKAHQVPYYYSTSMSDAYDGVDLRQYQVTSTTEFRYETNKLKDIYSRYPKSFESITPAGKTCYTCGIRKYGLHINSGFQLQPCSETHFDETKSNLLETGISAAIQKYRTFVNGFIGKPIVGCSGCEASATCKMCSAKAETIRNDKDIIIDFKVPEGHCDRERKKIRAITELIITE